MLKSTVMLAALVISAPAQADTLTAKQKALVKTQVASVMKDPWSVVMGPMYAKKTPSGAIAVCGTVNAKNSYGAWAGFSWYQASVVGNYATLITPPRGASDLAIQADCQKYGVM